MVFAVFFLSILVLLFTTRCSLDPTIDAAIDQFASTEVTIPNEAEEYVEVLKRRAAREARSEAENVEVKRVEFTIWPNDCLGVRDNLANCNDFVTPGYKVELEVRNQTFLYHISSDGRVVVEP